MVVITRTKAVNGHTISGIDVSEEKGPVAKGIALRNFLLPGLSSPINNSMSMRKNYVVSDIIAAASFRAGNATKGKRSANWLVKDSWNRFPGAAWW